MLVEILLVRIAQLAAPKQKKTVESKRTMFIWVERLRGWLDTGEERRAGRQNKVNIIKHMWAVTGAVIILFTNTELTNTSLTGSLCGADIRLLCHREPPETIQTSAFLCFWTCGRVLTVPPGVQSRHSRCWGGVSGGWTSDGDGVVLLMGLTVHFLCSGQEDSCVVWVEP